MEMFLLSPEPGNSPAGNQEEKQTESTPPGQDKILSCLATSGRTEGWETRGYDQNTSSTSCTHGKDQDVW